MRYNWGMAKAGRKPKNDPSDAGAIQEKIEEYFLSLEDEEGNQTPPTFSGLALALGYASRQSLWENATSGEPISLPIKRAMLRIESFAETRAYGNNAAGPIFILKNRGWSDKQEVEHSGTITGRLTKEERKARIDALKAKLD